MGSSESRLAHTSERVHGLDVFRSWAILFVLIAHMSEHSKLPEQLRGLSSLGVLGVELFFVLSGFLIGGIIMRLLERGRLHTMSDVATFWKRRWLRTLPMYFVALLAFLRFDYHGRHGLLDYPAYFVFMQNFAWKIPDFFELSWSLAIEEHFYLWFPLVLLLWHRLVRRMWWAVGLTALSFVCVAYAFRLSLPLYTEWMDYARNVRVPVLSRMDAIMFGVLMAALKQHWPGVFAFLRRITPVPATLLLLLMVWWFVYSPGLLSSRAIQINLFTVQALLCALLLPWFDGKSNANTSPENFFAVTSKLSYSLYLTHILVIVAVNTTLSRLGLFDLAYGNPFIVYPLYAGLFYATAWVTYHRVEAPFLALREKKLSLGSVFQASWFSLLACLFLVFIA